MRLRSERISSAESSESSLAHPVPAGWPARGQAAHLLPVYRNTSGVLGGVLNVIAGRICLCGVRAFCHPALSADVAALHPGAVCSVNNVIAYYLSQEFGRRYGRSSAGFPYRMVSVWGHTLDGDFENKRLFWLAGCLATRRIRTGYWNVQNHTPSDICPVVPERQHLSWRSDSSSLSYRLQNVRCL